VCRAWVLTSSGTFVHPSASAVWPPAGIALAALLWFGRGLWPGVMAGAFLVNVTTAGSWRSRAMGRTKSGGARWSRDSTRA